MTFYYDENLKKDIFTLVEDESTVRCECEFLVCKNPVCSCGSVEVVLTPLQDVAGDAPQQPSRSVDLDVVERKLHDTGLSKMAPEEVVFANLFLSQLDEADFVFLWEKYFAYKHKISEAADIEDIKGYFDYDAVEQDGLMYAYNSVLPYGDQFHFTINQERYMLVDHFCLLPKCSCTEVFINIEPEGWEWGDEEPWCELKVLYGKKRWEAMTAMPVPIKKVRAAIETQNPNFYKRLGERHEKLKKIYLNGRAKESLPVRVAQSIKTGRNDPCPCGSGKKYKKCCLGKLN